MPKSPGSEPRTNQAGPYRKLLDRDGLVDASRDAVAPAMRTGGRDSGTEQPTEK